MNQSRTSILLSNGLKGKPVYYSMDSIPYLLGVDDLHNHSVRVFNSLKQKQDPTFVQIAYKWEIRTRPEVRADPLWSKCVPEEKEGMSASTARYVMVPLEMVPFVVVDEYDGAEGYYIDYNAYGIKKIQAILIDPTQTEKLVAIQQVINTVAEGLTGKIEPK